MGVNGSSTTRRRREDISSSPPYLTHFSKMTDEGLAHILKCFPVISFIDLKGCNALTHNGVSNFY